MTKYSKFNIIYRLQKWLDSVPGQTFMNYAYSWGASIVILGTLFKLTHLPGANLMLFIGMGTEVFVFFIAAFDRPFDKTADGMELPTHVEDGDIEVATSVAGVTGVSGISGISGGSGGTVIIGGGAVGGDSVATDGTAGDGGIVNAGGVVNAGGGVIGGGGFIGGGVIGGVVEQPELPDIDADEMEEATAGYVEQLKKLTETLQKVSEQSERLTRDSEEMENLNRSITGIATVYELQLRNISKQVSTIEQIDEQTRRMAQQIEELNNVYARMIKALTINMKVVPGTEENEK